MEDDEEEDVAAAVVVGGCRVTNAAGSSSHGSWACSGAKWASGAGDPLAEEVEGGECECECECGGEGEYWVS